MLMRIIGYFKCLFGKHDFEYYKQFIFSNTNTTFVRYNCKHCSEFLIKEFKNEYK